MELGSPGLALQQSPEAVTGIPQSSIPAASQQMQQHVPGQECPFPAEQEDGSPEGSQKGQERWKAADGSSQALGCWPAGE